MIMMERTIIERLRTEEGVRLDDRVRTIVGENPDGVCDIRKATRRRNLQAKKDSPV